MRSGARTVLFLAPALYGCAGSVAASDATGDAEATTTSAVVIVERSADSTGAVRAEASARFVRIASTSSMEEGLRTIGAAVDMPPQGECAPILALTAHDDPAPFVELLDVGAVSIQGGGGVETRLVPRQLPDVTDVVSGVVYARTADPVSLQAGGAYVLHVGGGPDVAAFDATAAAPGDPADVRAGDETDGTVLRAPGTPIDLTWPSGSAGDLVYVDVQPLGARCLLGEGTDDAGGSHGSIPAGLLGDTGTLIIHRLHRQALHAKALDGGEIRFDFTRSIAYARR